MKPKMSCVNNCNSEVIWKTNTIQIVHLIPFESRVVREEMIACTSGNITSRFKPASSTWAPLFWSCWLKCQQRSRWQHKGSVIWHFLHTLLSNCMTRDLKDTKWISWWYSGQQSSQWGFVGNDPVLSLYLWYYFQALTSDGSVPGSRALGRSGLRFSGLFWLGEQVLLSAYIN